MRRPLPTLPRGPARTAAMRARTSAPARQLLSAPKVSPEWELSALRALMKPHDWTRGAIAHRPAQQPWPAGAAQAVESATAAVAQRLGWEPAPLVHCPGAGEVWFVIEVDAVRLEETKALAVVVSKRLPGMWLQLGRLYVRDGRFFRRKRDNTFKFRLVPATSVHVPRPLRAAIRGLDCRT